jgi:hypothetical protein
MCAHEANPTSNNDSRGGRRSIKSKMALVLGPGLTILFLAVGSLLWPAHRLTYAAGSATADQTAMASPDVCDGFGGTFLPQFSPFGFFNPSPFVNVNPGAFVTFGPSAFVTNFNGLLCTTTCSGIPAVLLPVCSAPPASITSTSSLATTSCGSNENLSFSVINTFGLTVLDGTTVAFSSNLGTITPSTTTNGGVAIASLQIPPRQSGVAQIQAFTGGVSTQKSIVVSC